MSEIRPNDVILGRGGFGYKHPGNEAFRELAKTLAPRYISSSKPEKSQISKEMVYTVYNLNPPGRFLKRVGEDEYEEAGFIVAREKASQCLRDASALLVSKNFDVEEYKKEQKRLARSQTATPSQGMMPPGFQQQQASYSQAELEPAYARQQPYSAMHSSYDTHRFNHMNYRTQSYASDTNYNMRQRQSMCFPLPNPFGRRSNISNVNNVNNEMQGTNISFPIPVPADYPPSRNNPQAPMVSPLPSFDMHDHRQTMQPFYPTHLNRQSHPQIPRQLEIPRTIPDVNPSTPLARRKNNTQAFKASQDSNSPISDDDRDYLATPPMYGDLTPQPSSQSREKGKDDKIMNTSFTSPDNSKISIGMNVDEIENQSFQFKLSPTSQRSSRSMRITKSKSHDDLSTFDLEKVSTSKSWSPQSAKMLRSRSFDDFEFLHCQSTSQSINSIDSFNKPL